MENISLYLKKFTKLELPDIAIKKALKNAIEEILMVSISEGSISVIRSTAHIRAYSALRAEIFMNKDAILKLVEQKITQTKLSDVR